MVESRRMSAGKWFHACGAATEKDLDLKVVWVRRISNIPPFELNVDETCIHLWIRRLVHPDPRLPVPTLMSSFPTQHTIHLFSATALAHSTSICISVSPSHVTHAENYNYSSIERRPSLGDRAFPVAAARSWNTLPVSLRTVSSYLTFCRELKTFLFNISFPDNRTVCVTL